LSASDAILIFLDRHNEIEEWLHLRGGVVAARGADLEAAPALADPETGDTLRVIAIVPGDAVTLHWLEVPAGLAPAQAIAAARLMAADVSAQPVPDMHVAVGPEASDEPARAVALVPAITMAGWIGRLQAQGLDPDLVLPEPLLLPRPQEGFVRHDRGPLPLFRGRSDAFSVEPELAGLVLANADVVSLDAAQFEAGIAEAVAHPPVNLRQGAFAKRRRWKLEWKLIRRLVSLALGILLITLAIQVVSILRYTYAADALEVEANRVAARALPRVTVSNAPAQLERRLTELGGAGGGYSDIAAAVFAAVRDTPNAELTGLIFDPGGSLRATVQADSPATLTAFQERIGASGFTVEAGPLRTAGGRPVAELTVRAR
jgi:general secretion pathway protein L